MEIEDKLLQFVEPYYANKDLMHDLTHIKRVIKKAEIISKNHKYNKTILLCGAYLHGVISKNYGEVVDFLEKNVKDTEFRNEIINCAIESDKSSNPKTIEGKIIHDAHLLEGGIYYGIIKSFITGSIREQSLIETIDYYKENILYKFKCSLPENQKELDKLYKTSEVIINDIEENI